MDVLFLSLVKKNTTCIGSKTDISLLRSCCEALTTELVCSWTSTQAGSELFFKKQHTWDTIFKTVRRQENLTVPLNYQYYYGPYSAVVSQSANLFVTVQGLSLISLAPERHHTSLALSLHNHGPSVFCCCVSGTNKLTDFFSTHG